MNFYGFRASEIFERGRIRNEIERPYYLGITCDVTHEEQVALMISKAVSTYGKFDAVFNNAGIAGPSGPFTE